MRAVRQDASVFIALDPGLTTGIATFIPTGDPQFLSGEIKGRFLLYEYFEKLLSTGLSPNVVCEKFIISSRTLQTNIQYDSLFVIGHVEAVCHKLGIPFTLQTPGEGKGFGTDAKLKLLGWYVPSAGGHQNDAARHLITHVVKFPSGQPLLRKIAEGLSS